MRKNFISKVLALNKLKIPMPQVFTRQFYEQKREKELRNEWHHFSQKFKLSSIRTTGHLMINQMERKMARNEMNQNDKLRKIVTMRLH